MRPPIMSAGQSRETERFINAELDIRRDSEGSWTDVYKEGDAEGD